MPHEIAQVSMLSPSSIVVNRPCAALRFSRDDCILKLKKLNKNRSYDGSIRDIVYSIDVTALLFRKIKQTDRASTRKLYASRIDSCVTPVSVIPERLPNSRMRVWWRTNTVTQTWGFKCIRIRSWCNWMSWRPDVQLHQWCCHTHCNYRPIWPPSRSARLFQ